MEKEVKLKLTTKLIIVFIFSSIVGLLFFSGITSYNNKGKELSSKVKVKYSLVEGMTYDYLKSSELLADEYFKLTNDRTYVKGYIGTKQVFENEKNIDGLSMVIDETNTMGNIIPKNMYSSKTEPSKLILNTNTEMYDQKEKLKLSINEYNGLVEEYNNHIHSFFSNFSKDKHDLRFLNINWEG